MSGLCLYCRLVPVYPEEAAGLCVSCRSAVASGELVPIDHSRLPFAYPDSLSGLYLHTSATDATPYLPECHTPDASEQAELRAELFALPKGKIHDPASAARKLIADIRACGVRVWLNTGQGHAELSPVYGCPYALMAEFVRLLVWVEDELTRERSGLIQRQNVQVEHFREGTPNAEEIRYQQTPHRKARTNAEDRNRRN